MYFRLWSIIDNFFVMLSYKFTTYESPCSITADKNYLYMKLKIFDQAMDYFVKRNLFWI
jgi:hypothetical protein